MPLTTCPDCGTKVSTRAAACPRCAAPLTGAVTTEQTGKRWKAVQLIGAGILILAACWIGRQMAVASEAGLTIAFVAAVIGLATLIAGQVGAWWFHG